MSRFKPEDFDLLEVLGQGGFGTVYKAINKSNGGEYAIKIIEVQNMDKRTKEITYREFRIMQNISCKQDNIICYYEMWDINNKFVVVMELLKGFSLYDIAYMKKSRNDSFVYMELYAMIEQTLLGLEFIHSHNVAHRDIKDENIMLAGDRIVIIDFGLSCMSPMHNTIAKDWLQCDELAGTPLFMAPEVRDGRVIADPSLWIGADIYSTGLVFLKLANLQDIPHILTSINIPSTYPKNIHKVINAALTKDPSKRPNATQLLKMLRQGDEITQDYSFINELPSKQEEYSPSCTIL